METIIPPVDKRLLEQELNEKTFLRETNNGHNEIYILNDANAPNVVREIGRLREVTFRDAGGGNGKDTNGNKEEFNERSSRRQLHVGI